MWILMMTSVRSLHKIYMMSSNVSIVRGCQIGRILLCLGQALTVLLVYRAYIILINPVPVSICYLNTSWLMKIMATCLVRVNACRIISSVINILVSIRLRMFWLSLTIRLVLLFLAGIRIPKHLSGRRRRSITLIRPCFIDSLLQICS